MPLGSSRTRLTFTIGVLTATACLSAGAPASAGTFAVVACNDAPMGRADAWAPARTAPAGQFDFAVVCPSGAPDPYGLLRNGIGVTDTVNAWDEAAPDGSYAEWRFAAPAGTAVVAVRVTRDIGNRDEWTPYASIDGTDQAGESCMRGMNQSFCRIQGTRTFTGLNARSIAYGVRCVTAPYCAHLWDLRAVWVLILGATVTLDDREAPTVSVVDAVGLADGRWWNRAGVVSFDGHDNTGVRRRAVVVDGVVRATADAPGAASGGCRDVGLGEAYAYARPCADARGLNGSRSLTVNPCGWGDGAHAVKGRVTDTGGLEATSAASTTVRVDCSAPLVVAGGPGPEVTEGEALEPTVSATDPASGVATTEVQVRVDDGWWQPLTTPVEGEAGRAYEFRARAVDVAGNWSAWAQTEQRTVAVAPPAEEPPAGEDPPPAPDDAPAAGAKTQPPPATDIAEAFTVSPATTASPLDTLSATARPAQDAARPPARAPAGLRITRVLSRPNGVTEVAGTAAPALTTRATVTVRTPRGLRRRRTSVAGGRWRVRIRTGERTRANEVRIATPVTSTHAAGVARWRRPLAQSPLR
jgi:hypothetical protein